MAFGVGKKEREKGSLYRARNGGGLASVQIEADHRDYKVNRKYNEGQKSQHAPLPWYHFVFLFGTCLFNT